MKLNSWGKRTWHERNPLPSNFDINKPKRELAKMYNKHRRVISRWIEMTKEGKS